MNSRISKAIVGFLKWIPGVRGVVARFEAAYTQWGQRRWLMTSYQDARFEVDFGQSMEICRKHLDFVENCPLVQRIRNLKIQFSVGVDGLMVIPNASDPTMDKKSVEAWNETRSSRWEQWCKSPDISSNLSLAELTLQWEGMLFDVGNIIVLKTFDENKQPKVQTIDRLRLATPPELASEEGKAIIQGIRLKQISIPVIQVVDGKRTTVTRTVTTGKPQSYFIRDEFDLNSYSEVPAENVIHKFRALRPGMMVGIPEAFSVINTLHDYTDLHLLEMQCAKLASEIANIETNPSGELDVAATRKVRAAVQSQDHAGLSVVKNTDQFYKLSFGGKNIAMKTGDKLENFMINRPTVATQNYWDLLLSQICVGYNVPKLLVVPYSLQGTVTRADLDICSTAFRGDFEIVKSVVREIYEWQTQWAVKFDRGMDGKKPANFTDCVIRPPRAPNVDIGYTAQALALELEMATKTFQDVCAERNLNWRIQLRESAEYQAFKLELAKEYGVDPNSISFTQFQSQKSQPQEKPEDQTAQPAQTA